MINDTFSAHFGAAFNAITNKRRDHPVKVIDVVGNDTMTLVPVRWNS